MCGIGGVIGASGPDRRAAVARMLDAMAHRGPDGCGLEERRRAILGHRRLAIIDLEHGRQPMVTPDGRFAITFNGCIYNYRELRDELEGAGAVFRTTSDTEVLLYAFVHWGPACLDRLNGMFAFVAHDTETGEVFAARDRLGIKPFYWRMVDGALWFASEIKALFAAFPGESARVHHDGLRQYLTFQLCLGARTLYEGVEKLPPGHSLSFRPGDSGPRVRQYWDLRFDIDEDHSAAWFQRQLRDGLEDSVRLRLRADVPLGAHLSGGTDSSVVVGLARQLLPPGHDLHTFTGAFEDGPQYDERRYARLVAEEHGTVAHEVVMGAGDFADSIEKVIWHLDEPAAGPGVFPQFLVSKLASEHVKVVLGGQGGDELFIGYARYLVAYLEECLKGAIADTELRDGYVATLGTIVPNLPSLQNYVPMLRSFWSRGAFDEPSKRYFALMDRFGGVAGLLDKQLHIDRDETFDEFCSVFEVHGAASMINRILYFDVKTHLQSLLHVEDRTSMAWGLESRVPLLDHRLVELMASVAPRQKFKDGRLKHMFLDSVEDLLPATIRDRRDKMGFPVPLADWAKTSLREFLGDILGSARARQRGVFDADALRRAVDGESAFGRTTWGALCLELWFRQFADGDGLGAV